MPYKQQHDKTLDADGSFSLTEYDALGRLVKQTSPSGRVTLTAYNVKGEVSATAIDIFLNPTRQFWEKRLKY